MIVLPPVPLVSSRMPAHALSRIVFPVTVLFMARGTAGSVQVHAGFCAIDDGVSRDRIPVGADIDAIVGRCAKDSVAGNGNAVTETPTLSVKRAMGSWLLPTMLPEMVISAVFCCVVEQYIGRGRHRWIPIDIVDHDVVLDRSRGSKSKLDAVLSCTPVSEPRRPPEHNSR